MLLGPLFGMPLALLPLQILWMNLVTDGLPALALTVEPAEKNVMLRPPNPAAAKLFDRRLVSGIIWAGILMALFSILAGYTHLADGQSTWQTMVFTTLTLSQMAFALSVRSESDSLFRIGLFSNLPMLGAILLTFILQLALIYLPFLNNIFSTTPLSALNLALSIGLGVLLIATTEIVKWITRLRARS